MAMVQFSMWVCDVTETHILWAWWYSYSEFVVLAVLFFGTGEVHVLWYCWCSFVVGFVLLSWFIILVVMLIICQFCGGVEIHYLSVLWSCWSSWGFMVFNLLCSCCGIVCGVKLGCSVGYLSRSTVEILCQFYFIFFYY